MACQRISPIDSVPIAKLLRQMYAASRMLTAFPVTGEKLEIWFSDFRDSHIVKCLATPGTLFNYFIEVLNQVFDGQRIPRHYHLEQVYTTIPITVLEEIEAQAPIEPRHHTLVQQPLFIAEDIIVSQILPDYSFRILEHWKL